MKMTLIIKIQFFPMKSTLIETRLESASEMCKMRQLNFNFVDSKCFFFVVRRFLF